MYFKIHFKRRNLVRPDNPHLACVTLTFTIIDSRLYYFMLLNFVRSGYCCKLSLASANDVFADRRDNYRYAHVRYL